MQGPVILDEELQNNQSNGINFKKAIVEILNNKNVTLFMNVMNLSNTLFISLLYLYRTYTMCFFD